MKKKKWLVFGIILVLSVLIFSGCSVLEGTEAELSDGNLVTDEAANEGDDPLAALFQSRSQSLQLVGLITILSLAPSILIVATGFVRIVIVMSFTRNALGLQQMPPNQVIVVLSLFLTLFVMAPQVNAIKEQAIDPYINNEIGIKEAVNVAEDEMRGFMLKQTFSSDLHMFNGFAQKPAATISEMPMSTIVPAFLTSEIKRAFQIGFFIYIPFIVIDMVVASVLMAMGMMMLPPIVISLPFKVLLFILVDGWTLTVSTLITSFNV